MNIKGFFVFQANRPYSRDTMDMEMMDDSEGKVESHKKFAELLNTEGAYSPVAFVYNVDNIEKTFELTNHIDHDWTENRKNVIALNPTVGKRSTSVGDIVLDTVKEKAFLVSGCGFRELNQESIDVKRLIDETSELTKKERSHPNPSSDVNL